MQPNGVMVKYNVGVLKIYFIPKTSHEFQNLSKNQQSIRELCNSKQTSTAQTTHRLKLLINSIQSTENMIELHKKAHANICVCINIPIHRDVERELPAQEPA